MATTFTKFPVREGGLSEEDRDRILALAEAGVKAWSIARRLERHPSTVAYFMYRNGLKTLAPRRRAPFYRAGKLVQTFSAEDDAYIVEMASEGFTPARISELMGDRFGVRRTRDMITSRLMLLASDETAREDLVAA